MGAGQSEQQIRAKLVDAKTVIVVGGSYTGTGVARLLQKDFNVIILERKNYHLHNVGALRCCVDPTWTKNICIPYDRSLPYGNIVQAEVHEITPTQITIKGRQEPLKFDYCIIATGTSYAFPARVAAWQVEDVKPMYDDVAKAIEAAKSIVVVGGGPTGVELCGEIRDVYSSSDKKITLIQGPKYLIPSPPTYELGEKFREQMLHKVKEGGVDVQLGERIQLDDSLQESFNQQYYITGQRTIRTDKNSYDCDLLFWAFGSKVNSQAYSKHFAASMNPQGRLKVENTMQVQGHKNIFAVGDCSVGGTRGEMMMVFVGLQTLPTVAANINLIERGSSTLQQFKGPSPAGAMIVPFGKKGGVSQLPKPLGLCGDFVTRNLKSKDLMTNKTWESLGYNGMGDAGLSEETRLEPDIGKLVQSLGIDEAGAMEMAKGMGIEEGFMA